MLSVSTVFGEITKRYVKPHHVHISSHLANFFLSYFFKSWGGMRTGLSLVNTFRIMSISVIDLFFGPALSHEKKT